MNKFKPNTIKIDGVDHDRSKIVFIPTEKDGKFATSDGKRYCRDAKGFIRKVK